MKKDNWSTKISSKNNLFDINIREILNFKDLLILLVKRDFKSQYKQTILGPLWHILQPVITTLIFIIVFSKIAKIPTNNVEPIVFYMSGLTIWNYFTTCFGGTSNVLSSNAHIFGKVYFPRLIVPLSTIISAIFKFFIQFFILVVVGFYYNSIEISQIYLWPILIIIMLIVGILALGIGLIFSSLTIKYRDLGILGTFFIQVLMYCTPIIYPIQILSNDLKWIILLNPLSGLTEIFKAVFFGNFEINMLVTNLYSFGFSIIILFIGILIFNRVEKSYIDVN